MSMCTEGVGAADGGTVRKYTTLDPVELSEEAELSELVGEETFPGVVVGWSFEFSVVSSA